MQVQPLAGTELVKVMLISLNVDVRRIQSQSRFDEDMGLTLGQIDRLYGMVGDCFRIQLDVTAITCLDDLLKQIYSSDFIVEATS